jgi:hypothetical protein
MVVDVEHDPTTAGRFGLETSSSRFSTASSDAAGAFDEPTSF